MNELFRLSNFAGVKNVSRETIEAAREEIAEKVKEGFLGGLETEAFFRLLLKIYEGDDKKNNGLKDLIKEQVKKEYSLYGEKNVRYGAFEITESDAGGKYDYSTDNIWVELNEKAEAAIALRKEREKFLLAIPDGKSITEVQEGGEVVTIYRPVKSGGSSGVKFTMLK